MSGKSNAHETALLRLEFTNTAYAGIGDASGLQPSAAQGSLYLALMTAATGLEDGLATSETTYTSYARVATDRTSGTWTVGVGTVTNAAEEAFPTSTGGTQTVTHFALCKAGTAGVDDIIRWGALDNSRLVQNGLTPRFPAGELVFTED